MLEQLLGRYGDVAVTEHELANEAIAPEQFWDRWERLHPMWISARRQLEPAGEWEALRDASIAALRDSGCPEPLPACRARPALNGLRVAAWPRQCHHPCGGPTLRRRHAGRTRLTTHNAYEMLGRR
ncbi:MAG TPA: hypothetical protein VHZ75_11415 [Solirubrobacteraceae bacterium]|nr:hypothetical protein [Solirubrobacteraceae bacterium]